MSNNNEDSNNNTQPRTTTKEEAIRLLSKGIGVIPLQNPEEPIRFNGETDEDFAKSRRSELDRRKQPAIKWTPYKTRLATIEEANNWFTFNPNYNLAIVCGDVSGGLIAVDVDGGKAKKQIEDKFPAMSEGLRKVLNSTMGNVTGSGGLHFVFYVEGGKTDISQLTIWLSDEKHSEIKIQGNYHYIASAPSRSPHNNGKLYESNGKDIAVITLEQLNEFIQTVGLPELVNKKQSVDPAARQESDDDDDDKASKTNSSNQVMAELEGTRALTPEQMQQLLDEVMACYDEGRNEVIYTLPAAMRKEGLTYDTTREFVILVGKTANDSSRDRDRSLDKVDRTYSKAIEEIKGKSGLKEYLVGAFGQDGLERFSRICQIINNPDFSRDALVEAVKEEKKRGGWEDGNGNGNGEAHQDDDDDDDSTTPGAWLKRQKERDTALDVIGALRDEILRKDRFITIKATIKEKNEIRVYRNGTYEPGGEDRINELTVTLGGSHASTHVLNEVVRLIRFDERRRMDLSAFHSDINLITVGNGLLDIFTWELKDHTPDHLSTFKYPMDYDAEADCPTTEKFLTDVIAEPHKLREFLKFWAYILLKDCRYEKAAMFVGGGANGKGKLIMLMEAQEGGWDRCSHISLHDLGDDRFATAGLHDKTLNTVADLMSDKIKGSTGNIKLAISGDAVEGQFKYGHRFTFKNRAKIVYSANNPPETDDKTYAFFRRWLIIAFDRTFVNTDDPSDPNRKDAQLVERIIANPREMSGILNLRLKYLKVLMKENGFVDEPFEVVKNEYESRAEHITRYLHENCTVNFNNFSTEFRTDTKTLYADYLDWGKTNNISDKVLLAENMFGSKLAELGIRKRDRKRKGVPRGYDYMHIILDANATRQTSLTTDPKEANKQAQIRIENHENDVKKPQTCKVCNQELPSLKDLQVHTIFRHPEEELPTAIEQLEEENTEAEEEKGGE